MVFALGVIGLITASYSWYSTNTSPLAEAETEQVVFTVEAGSSVEQIGQQLEEEGIIASARAFAVYSRIHNLGAGLQAGGYRLSPSMSVEEIMAILNSGDVASDLVTILPGLRIDQVAASLAENTNYPQAEISEASPIFLG